MHNHIINRTGDAPLEFKGELIGFASNRNVRPSWTNISIYRTAAGQYVSVVHRMKRGLDEVEVENTKASVCPSVAALLLSLEWNPVGKGGVARAALAEAATKDRSILEATKIHVA